MESRVSCPLLITATCLLQHVTAAFFHRALPSTPRILQDGVRLLRDRLECHFQCVLRQLLELDHAPLSCVHHAFVSPLIGSRNVNCELTVLDQARERPMALADRQNMQAVIPVKRDS